ncbi:MAG TPA: hypothetical protein VFT59_03625 [Candidatus Saccharimonadales bacterium]|nr:hypothetical protein [Candidatus Saccharimonadales bacterium]
MSKEVPTPPSEEPAFEAITRANPNLQWLSEPVPPWGVASGDLEAGVTDSLRAALPVDTSDFPVRITPEERFQARLECDVHLDKASKASPLFGDYLSALYRTVRRREFGDQGIFTSNEPGFQAHMAASIVKEVPDPADAASLLQAAETPDEQAKADAQTQAFLDAAEKGTLHYTPPQHVLDEMIARARYVLDPRNRQLAYDVVLSTIYGKRYEAFSKYDKDQPE